MKPMYPNQVLFSKTALLLIFNFLFSMSAFAQPSNNDCSGATNLISNTSCNNIQYRMKNATASAGIPVGCAAGGTHYDVWFSFTALSTTHTITISNLQNSFTNPEIQLFSGNCGSLTSVICGTLTMTPTGLTIGNTYYVRVSNIGSQITSNQDRFDICITHPNPPPANDDCSGATTLTPGYTCSSTTGNIRYATSNGPAGACGGATITTTYDVWYIFQATATTHAVGVSNLGSNFSAASTYMEVLSGSCGSQVSLGCQTVATTSGRLTLSSLTIGTFYYVRVYVLSNPTASTTTNWNFDICVQQPPVNNECAGAVVLTPGATCSNTAGTLDLATSNTTGVVTGCWAANTYNDVWYQFTATGTTQTITLSSLGANITTPRIQIYSGTCGALALVGCATTSTLTQGGLTIGNTYYLRIANTSNPSGVGTVANFNICVTAAAAPPSNDLCTGAITLTSSSTCSNISGTLINATATAGLTACGANSNTTPEVWYSFVAQTAYPTITLSTIGTNFNSAGPRIQIFSGACGSLTSLACTTNPLNVRTAVGGAGLTIGNTYYVRILTNSLSAPVASGTYTFNICVTDPVSTASAILDYSKSYVNLSDTAGGGTIDPGDILEIRATLVVRPNGAVRAIDSVAFYDTLKAGGGLHYYDSIAIRTNEGKLYKYFTESNTDADAGWYTTAGAGTDTTIQINMGPTASRYARGKLNNLSRPRFNSGATSANCIILATYRVVVNASYGQSINFGGGAFTYRDSATGVFSTIQFPYDSIMVFESPGSCQNTVSQTNILGDENNGTFGSGTTQNRGTSPNTTYSYTPFAASTPQDYNYGIANNTSATGSTNQLLAKSNAARVHGVWDISGDHTGAANTAQGNLPATPGSSGGYMLAINAAYRTDVAFNFNVSGACPNTYYEISFWLKNICYKCGCDSMGRFTGSAGYIPTAAGDSAGVRPNIAVEINGKDYYTTGNIRYLGLGGTQTGSDTLNQWVQRSFVYKTGTNETSFTLNLRNNAPGGGGNDWALDDISLKTCTPTMNYSPSNSPFVCANNQITIYDTVRCYYDTYVEYKWQRSTDGGVTWVDVAGATGTGAPTWNGSQWEYVTSYTIPGAYTTAANDGDMYRLVVATTSANLSSSSCYFTDPVAISLTVDPDCGPPLKTDLLSITGTLNIDKAKITWVTTKEDGPVSFDLQRSDDGNSFHTITTVTGYNDFRSENNIYSYNDPTQVTSKVYYRIIMLTNGGNKKYSRIVQLNPDKKDFGLGVVVNPFNNELQYEITTPQTGIAITELIDQYGVTVKRQTQRIEKGVNALKITSTENLSSGIYTLKVTMNGTFTVRRVMKGNN
jgi:hypothetical protein